MSFWLTQLTSEFQIFSGKPLLSLLLYSRRCRVKWRFLESGQRVRVSTRTNTIIPRPVTYVRPVRKGIWIIEIFYKLKKKNNSWSLSDGPKDTPSSEVLIKTFDELSVVPVLDEDLLERIQLKWSLLADARAKREEERKKAIIENATKPDEVKIKKKPIWITQMEEDLRNHQVLQGSVMPTLLADKKKGVNQELLDEADADDKLGASATIGEGDVDKKEQDEAAHHDDEDEGDEKPAASNKKKKLKGKKKQ